MVEKKLKLYGFNNLTKTLSFNIYDICYAKKKHHSKKYIKYIDEVYSSKRLRDILNKVSDIIGAKILNTSYQDYDPHGASVTMLICEKETNSPVEKLALSEETPGPLPSTVVAHLDKSHITVHTYPDNHPDNGISTFRVDIDVSTCGVLSPLKALNFLLHSFESDIVTVDYRVRGFTRNVNGKKLFIDHDINSIQNYLLKDVLEYYQLIDVNIYQENIFHVKMLIKEFIVGNYLFGTVEDDFSQTEIIQIKQQLKREMLEIFYGRNISEDIARKQNLFEDDKPKAL